MSFFSRRRRAEQPQTAPGGPTGAPADPTDPLAALQRAEEALANTDFAGDGDGHWSRLDPALKAQMQEGMEKARAAYESGGASAFAGGFPQGTPSAFSLPAPIEDPITKVERLAKLREDGALTEDEFNEQKRKALEEG